MQVTYKFRLYPKKEDEKEGWKKVNSKTLQMVLFMLSYKAESAGKIVGDVNPRLPFVPSEVERTATGVDTNFRKFYR